MTGTVDIGDDLYLGFPDLDADYTGQDGTFILMALTFDYALGHAEVTDVSGGTITAKDFDSGKSAIQFKNQQAIVRFTLLDKADDSAINATSLTIEAKEGSSNVLIQTYDFATDKTTCGPITINPPAPETNVIYAALAPFGSNASNDYTLTATDADGETYTYTKTGVKFEWGKYYEIKVKMNRQSRTYDLSEAKGNITLKDGDVLTGTLDGEEQPYKISIAPGATVTLDGVTINGWSDNAADASHSSVAWAGLTCLGDATIILKEGTTNTVRGFYNECSGIQPGPSGTTLTIQGSGSLTANGSSGEIGGAGIGGGCSTCGNITITGGNGIIAWKGSGADYSVGVPFDSDGCEVVTIRGYIYRKNDQLQDPRWYLSQSPLEM